MSTIAALEKEIKMQINFLKIFVPQKQLSLAKQRKSIFCGTGDSFASAQLAEALSDFKVKAFDPLDLLKNKKLLKGRDLYLVSISGNTISNINLAKISNATAITANPESKLAKLCSRQIFLKYPNSGILTSGTISFLASALTCLSLVSKYEIKNILLIYKSAKLLGKKINLRGKIYVLGDLNSLPIAMFCASKLYEISGLDAQYERIEQFSHAVLFSAKKGDTVLLFEKKNMHNLRLERYLKEYGLNFIQIQPPTTKIQEQILFYIFVSEFIALHHAKKKNQKDCFFVQNKLLRKASSAMIY